MYGCKVQHHIAGTVYCKSAHMILGLLIHMWTKMNKLLTIYRWFKWFYLFFGKYTWQDSPCRVGSVIKLDFLDCRIPCLSSTWSNTPHWHSPLHCLNSGQTTAWMPACIGKTLRMKWDKHANKARLRVIVWKAQSLRHKKPSKKGSLQCSLTAALLGLITFIY